MILIQIQRLNMKKIMNMKPEVNVSKKIDIIF